MRLGWEKRADPLEGLMLANPAGDKPTHIDGVLICSAKDRDWLSFDSSVGLEIPAGSRIPMYGSLAGQVLRTGQPLYCEDVEADPRVDLRFSRAIKVRSVLCAPLRRGDSIVGVICFVSAQPAAFGEQFVSSFKKIRK